LRIDDLFEKIGMDKLQYIKTYSADTISKFTDPQIQTIIDHFTEKPNLDFTDDPEDQDSSNDVSEGVPTEKRTEEEVRAEEEYLASLGIIELPVKLSGDEYKYDELMTIL
jgi:hypothetical protein